jgi:hypothetical protein
MLLVEQRRRVIAAVADELSLRTTLQIFVRTSLPPYDVEVLGRIPTSVTLADEQATLLVDLCIADRWTRAPALLESVLDKLVAGRRGDLKDVLLQVQQRIDPNPDPTNALWVMAELPFFSRKSLRPLVAKLITADAQPILRIVGPETAGEECGKSYTLELIQHAARNAPFEIIVASAKIEKGLAAAYTVGDLTDALVAQADVDILQQPKSDASSNYARKLSTWILNAARRSGKPWIFVLDGFNQKDVNREVRDMVESLAQAIATGTLFRKLFRLVLLDHPAELPSVQSAIVLREDVPGATAVTADEVADCLAAHYAEVRSHPTKPLALSPARTELMTVATSLLAKAPSGPAGRLQAVQQDLHKLRVADLARAGR